jgi:hypothetical protein
VHAGDEIAVVAEHVERALAHPGHDPHRGRDVGGVGELDADVAIGEPSGPSRRARRTSCARHAALEEPVQRLAHLAGSRQLLVGPASSSRSEQMKVRSSTRATSPGSERAR